MIHAYPCRLIPDEDGGSSQQDLRLAIEAWRWQQVSRSRGMRRMVTVVVSRDGADHGVRGVGGSPRTAGLTGPRGGTWWTIW